MQKKRDLTIIFNMKTKNLKEHMIKLMKNLMINLMIIPKRIIIMVTQILIATTITIKEIIIKKRIIKKTIIKVIIKEKTIENTTNTITNIKEITIINNLIKILTKDKM
jgi:hypothetical protein